jgi:nitrite reductase/ring-hydroxylating ferredoxin subunit
VAAEVPLDGSVYDLATGAVLKWCPKDNPVRSLLGTLKSKVDPSPLKVYPVYVNKDGGIWTTLL